MYILSVDTIPRSKNQLEVLLIVARTQRRKKIATWVISGIAMVLGIVIMIINPMWSRTANGSMDMRPTSSFTSSSTVVYLPLVANYE